jgi:hypothetical protein
MKRLTVVNSPWLLSVVPMGVTNTIRGRIARGASLDHASITEETVARMSGLGSDLDGLDAFTPPTVVRSIIEETDIDARIERVRTKARVTAQLRAEGKL